jgi:hypothetical protein
VNPQISGDAFDSFFAWAPWVIGVAIYFAFYIAKRRECAPQPAASSGQTYACAGCGRRGSREQMVPQDHGGAVGWYCPHCASAQEPAT